jgi:uroporphyrinogen-III synthase
MSRELGNVNLPLRLRAPGDDAIAFFSRQGWETFFSGWDKENS